MMNRYLYTLLFSLTYLLVIGNPDALWQEANDAYKAKNYNKAIEKYEAILQSGSFSDELYYNLGNSYFRNKSIGKAILNFERALVLSPRDQDIQHNLELVKTELQDDIEVLPPFFLSKWWRNIHQLTSSTVWSIFSILSLILGVGGIALWLLGKDRAQRKKGFIGGISMVLMSLLFLAMARSQSAKEQDSEAAVVMKKEIVLRSGPDGESAEVLQLHEGTKVYLLDQIGDWHKVKIANGEQGWLEKSTLEKI